MNKKEWYKVIFSRFDTNSNDAYVDLKEMKEWLNKNVQYKKSLYSTTKNDKWLFYDFDHTWEFYFISKLDQVQFKLVFC